MPWRLKTEVGLPSDDSLLETRVDAAFWTAPEEKALAAEKQVAIVRALVIALNIFVYVFLMSKGGTHVPLAAAVAIVAGFYGAYVPLFQPYRRFPVLRSAAFTAITDGVLIVLWVWATGGFESPFFLLWYLSLSAVAFRFSSRLTTFVAGAYAAAYLGLLAALGELAGHASDVTVRVGYIFLIGLLGGYQAQEVLAQTQAKVRMRDLAHEAQRAEERLRESSEELRRSLSLLNATLDSTADGILVVDAKGGIQSFNQQFARMWRIPAEVLATRDDEKALEFVLGQVAEPEAFLSKVRELYAQPEAESFDELAFRDGRVFERYSRPHRLSGRPVGRVWSFRDVTARRQAEQENLKNLERAKEVERLTELDRFKTQFVNSVAHELWTPLTPIRLQLHMLESRGEALTETQKRSLRVIGRNMERLIHLVEELLDGARLQAGRFRVDREPMNLHRVVAEMVELFQAQAEDAGMRLAAQLEPELPIRGDANRLVQVMHNLLSNAVKFTQRGGTITVSSAARDGVARVSVADTGVGLTPQQMEKLFQPFSQAHDTMQQTRAGTGLGLYISHAIVEAHEGRLTARSGGTSQGAVFEFTIPLHPAELEKAGRAEPALAITPPA